MKKKAFFAAMNLRRGALLLLAVLLLVVFAWVVARSGPLAPVRVTVTTAGEGRVTPSLFGLATVEARRAYLIGPTLAGRVKQVAVDVGESVKSGQLLAEMDAVDLDARIQAAQAAIARARSGVSAAEAQVRDTQARQALATGNAKRYVDLGSKNFISPSAVEARLQEQSSAQAAQGAAQANLGGAREDIVRLEAERNALQQQRANLRLLAPADAVVSARDAEPGSTVVAGQAVLRLIDPSSLWLRLRLDQGRSAGLAVGLPARVALRSNPSLPLIGKVVRLEKLSDSITEERVALVALDQIPADLTVGELAEVTLELPVLANGVLLPNASIQRQGEQTGVWLVRDGSLKFVPVRLGQQSSDGLMQVLEGVKAGDSVVVHRDRALSENSRIKVVDALIGSGS
ncbi:MAG: efflux RND transporter periplasmic adaptor subunit [Azonexus sp.]|nr:efflux RND transporter periplasmic adaptor subunit [Azonexus sp.]